MKRHLALIPLFILALSIPACGPGFPIMTAEQEKFVDDVERLNKENETLKAKVARLEGGAGLKEEMESIKRSLADSNVSLEKIRQELAFVKGNIEEGAHDREKITEEAKAALSNTQDLNQRLVSIETSIKSVQDRLGSFETSYDEQDRRFSEVREAVAAIDKKAAALEKAIAETRSEAASMKAGDALAPREQEAETLYQKGYKETTSKDYPKAIDTFQRFLVAYPGHKYAGNAQYWLGEIYYARGDWEMAILEFDKAVKKYPESEKTPASLLKQGFAFEKIGAKKEARVLLNDVIKKFPASAEAGLAKKRLAALK
ncbi:MAG: tol-pal system protein YbgF [Deltaproteobacteria bacterium GWA2_55_10]|nr:MAG: tol-pal system protein YbgF [Deltaproteobacteria bacterium GWA2_55_10]